MKTPCAVVVEKSLRPGSSGQELPVHRNNTFIGGGLNNRMWVLAGAGANACGTQQAPVAESELASLIEIGAAAIGGAAAVGQEGFPHHAIGIGDPSFFSDWA